MSRRRCRSRRCRGSAREIKTQFEAWSARRLDDVELDYLFLDGSHFKYHANASAEPVLAAWGIDTDGKPVFVGLEAASSESGDAWEGFLDRARRARAGLPAAGDQRRRGRADRRRRAHHGRRAATTLPDPSRQKRAGQGAQKRPGAR